MNERFPTTQELLDQEREKCCRDICPRCRDGNKVELVTGCYYGHPISFGGNPIYMECKATKIRERARREEEERAVDKK